MRAVDSSIRAEAVAAVLAGSDGYSVARRIGVAPGTVYRWVRTDAPQVARRMAEEENGDDLPLLILCSLRTKFEVTEAIMGVFIDLAQGRKPVADQALVDYILSQPINKIARFIVDMDGMVLRSAACFSRVREAMGNPTDVVQVTNIEAASTGMATLNR